MKCINCVRLNYEKYNHKYICKYICDETGFKLREDEVNSPTKCDKFLSFPFESD